MDLGLKDKVVIVTGGGAGIGAAISQSLAEEAAIPVILARSAPPEAFLNELKSLSPKSGWLQADLSRDEECRRVIAQAQSQWGLIYGLVNNAGKNDSLGLDTPPEAFRASLDQNLLHYYTLAHLLQADLKASAGAIVNIASKTAVTGQGSTSAYVAAKAAQLGLTREWAAALGRARQRGGPRRSADPDVSGMAAQLPRSRRPKSQHHRQHPAWPAHDRSARDRHHHGLRPLAPLRPYHRAMAVCRWRLHPSRPRHRHLTR